MYKTFLMLIVCFLPFLLLNDNMTVELTNTDTFIPIICTQICGRV